ncbi:uncharacterized protein LOC116344188 [Contarinia nasturtii]|uniref:uncharacterized protein LOC116344188 n=1 Tax=Contarinia nasturtii TaxID=265458 RepID=UPI0012D39DCE|nr:uncharacterized protein LOC116344188 [Contarinia nasturtii]
MIIFVYTVICAVFLSERNGAFGGAISSKNSMPITGDDFNIDELVYQGDPIKFSCITTDSQHEFYITDVNGSIPSALVERLTNGKDLSLFFHDFMYTVDSSFDLLYAFAKEWYQASEKNICIVSYAYSKSSSKPLSMNLILSKMVATRRLEYAAKMTRDLLLGVRQNCLNIKWYKRSCLKHLSQVDVTGFGFGAHIASRTCQYLFEKTSEKVRLLLALDPLRSPPIGARIKNTIKKGIASYVQVIHTSQMFGIWDKIGDMDIYVKYEPEKNLLAINDEHLVAFFIHLATSTKRLFMAAKVSVNGNGTVLRSNGPTSVQPINFDYIIGVYGRHDWVCDGDVFGLSLINRNTVFWGAIGNFSKHEIFLGTQALEKDKSVSEDSDDCILCFENEKNALLLPCNHREICHSCWDMWEDMPRDSVYSTCPICRQEVDEVKIKSG